MVLIISNLVLGFLVPTTDFNVIEFCQFLSVSFISFYLPTQGSIMDSNLHCPRALRCYVIEFRMNSFALREDYQGK